MLVHFTIIKVLPEKVQEAAGILAGSKLIEYFLRAGGLRHGSLSESLDEPGKLLSLSMWDAPGDAQAVFADPNYAALVGELRGLLIAAPERVGYNLLHRQPVHHLEAGKNLFIHNTIVTAAPENTSRLISVLYSDQVIAQLGSTDGFLMSYAFEALEEPGRIVSMSWWSSAVEAQSTFASPVYAGLLGDLRAYFIKAPERQSYRLLALVRHELD
ncbi:MAG: hypothetical protein MUC85_10575 [Anaerolineales bacterium]|nr:hypothetical protein [Anaerolineales bacterium]